MEGRLIVFISSRINEEMRRARRAVRQATLQSDEPDLGTVQRVRRFFQQKGGWLARAGLALLSNPSVVAVVQEASKRLMGGST